LRQFRRSPAQADPGRDRKAIDRQTDGMVIAQGSEGQWEGSKRGSAKAENTKNRGGEMTESKQANNKEKKSEENRKSDGQNL
jgi:hypothetical protein